MRMADEKRRNRPEREMLDAFRNAMAKRSTRDAVVTAIRLGEMYLESDSYSDALGYYTQAEGDELASKLTPPELAALRVNIAKCYLGLGSYTEARDYCAAAGENDLGEEEGTVLAEADVILARVEIESGRYDEALRAAQKAYGVLRAQPDSKLLAEAGKALGIANAELGNIDAARDYFTDYLVCQKRLGDEAGLASAYNNLGILAKRAGHLNRALELLESSLEIDRKLGRSAAIADRLTNLGIILYKLSRWAESEEKLNEAVAIYTRIGATRGLVAAESALGNVFRARREWGRARELFERALRESKSGGYLRAEALALEFIGHLEVDQGNNEDALRTLNRGLAGAFRLASNSDVVGEVLRRRAEALYNLGRLEEAERDCTEGLKLTKEIGDHLEEGATLRVLASVCYAKGERAAAEALISQSEEILRKVGASFELATAALADGIGLRESSAVSGDVPVDRIEARFSEAEAIFTRLGAGYWVARCELERGKALKTGGQPERGRGWLERARLRFEVSHDSQGVAEVDAALGELDADLAEAVVLRSGRYTIIAEGYRFLEATEPSTNDLHGFASGIADVVSADRLVLFSTPRGEMPVVATSVDRSGRGLSEVTRYVRSVIGRRDHPRPLVLSDTRTAEAFGPDCLGALAIIPDDDGGRAGTRYIVYADRSSGSVATPFTRSDVEFLGAAARMLGLAHSRVEDSTVFSAGDELIHDLQSSPGLAGFVIQSPEMLRILASVERLRDSDVPVLISGESGVGKELIARAIHANGRSRTGKFVALNAGAIAPHLQESELFGHVKGAFTDADRDREGLVQTAADGTLFLDEVGEMSPQLQVKLLRFLQNGEYRRVGESMTRTSNARVISATNKDLAEEVRKSTFRRDLFYRLCTIVIEVPPLRERPEDIPLLMEHFLSMYSELEGKDIPGFSREVRDLFLRHDWHGNNVRELENEVRRGVALCADGEVIGIDKVRPELRSAYGGGRTAEDPLKRSLKHEVEALERGRILEALERTGWNKQAASDLLGLSRPGLHAKMKKYGIG